ncbi:Protein kinase domain-containing protein ppk32 [Coemansia javaensis]|uniref:Protein kinase domain-containing protein ppk32 n=1 Tax=Coemansia javaensis TaxID=2761396 RepID=A0A9W8H9D3_9FUNG|nr:Protein kinase domain-containing protein ppk32 [Coemansia javaensis]
MDTYLSKLRGLAAAAANAVQSKLGRDYEFNVGGPATGYSGLWTLYPAQRRSTGQAATVWVFEKQRFFESGANRQLLDEAGRQRVLALLAGEAGQLARLRHPSVLQVVEPLEDTRGALMFATEQVLASLDDLIAARRRAGGGDQSGDDDDLELDDLAIQKGLLQVSKGLQFLHDEARLVHGNVVPGSILVDARGDWKLGGLGFAQAAGRGRGYEHDYGLPRQAQAALDYWAPERALDGAAGPAGDAFALGCLAVAACCGRAPIASRNDVGAYRSELSRLERGGAAGLAALAGVPEPLARAAAGLLQRDPAQRTTLAQFQDSDYFDNVLVATLRYLERLVEQPADQKAAFLRGLPRVVPQFPARVQRRTLLPLLLAQTGDRALAALVLPSVFAVAQGLAPADFAAQALPGLRPLLARAEPPQAAVALLDGLPVLLAKCAAAELSAHVLPMVYAALLSAHADVQDRALRAVPALVGAAGPRDLHDGLLPRVQHVYAKTSSLAHKVRALMCLHQMLPALDRAAIVGRVMPLLARTRTREPAVVMAMLAMYEEIGLNHLDRRAVATDILPVLWAQCVDSRLRAPQFDRFAQVIDRLAARVRSEHRAHLEAAHPPAPQPAPALVADVDADADADVSAVPPGFAAGEPPMRNPLEPAPPMRNPLEPAPLAGAWEWDAPGAAAAAQGRIEADLLSTPSEDAQAADDNAAPLPFIPPPARSQQQHRRQQPSLRLHTPATARGTTTTTTTTSDAARGTNGTAAGHHAPALLPPPPPPPPPRSKLGATRLGPMRLGSPAPHPPASSPLAPSPRPPAAAPRPSQKHAGGKAADLGDFDPFA